MNKVTACLLACAAVVLVAVIMNPAPAQGQRLLIAKKIAAALLIFKPKKLYTVPFPLPLPIPILQKNQQVLVKEPNIVPVHVSEPVPYGIAEPIVVAEPEPEIW